MKIQILASSSSGNAVMVDDGKTKLLIEMGLPIRKLKTLLNHQLSTIDGALLSHFHKDHSLAANDVMLSGIDLYTSWETAFNLGLEGYRLHVVRPLEQFTIGSWNVLPFPTVHDSPGSLGFLLASGDSRIPFITDTMFVNNRFAGITELIIECNWSEETFSENIHPLLKDRIRKTHFSLAGVLEFCKANDLSRCNAIFLIHISQDNGDGPYFKRKIQEATGIPTYLQGE